jgi:hypothetical protein
MSPPLFPSLDHDLHFVLCDFGKNGQAFVKTDPAHADRNTVICNLIAGEYERPLNVIAFNLAEGWVCDVSESVAKAITKSGASLTAGTSAFVETHFVQIERSPRPDLHAGGPRSNRSPSPIATRVFSAFENAIRP